MLTSSRAERVFRYVNTMSITQRGDFFKWLKTTYQYSGAPRAVAPAEPAPNMFATDIAKAFAALKSAQVPMAYVAVTETVVSETVDEVYKEDCVLQQEEKEDTMTLDLQQVSFFRDALRQEKYTKLATLEKTFGLVDDDTPRTAEEIVARITAGKYTLRDLKASDDYGYSRFARFIWRDPSVKKDQVGFNAASEKLLNAYKLAKFAIMTAPADGAKAVTEFTALSFA